MNGQWTLPVLVLAAGLITAAGAVAVRAIGTGLRRVGRDAEARFSFCFGLIIGLTVTPVIFLMALRMHSGFFRWVLTGPFPLNRLDQPLFLLGLAAILVGGPVLALAGLNRVWERNNQQR